MSAYERTLSIGVPADSVFAYVSDLKNVPEFLPEAEGADIRADHERREVEWSGEKHSGTIHVDAGDVTPELSEITMRVTLSGRRPSSVAGPQDERMLETMEKALETIRKNVEQAHRTGSAGAV